MVKLVMNARLGICTLKAMLWALEPELTTELLTVVWAKRDVMRLSTL